AAPPRPGRLPGVLATPPCGELPAQGADHDARGARWPCSRCLTTRHERPPRDLLQRSDRIVQTPGAPLDCERREAKAALDLLLSRCGMGQEDTQELLPEQHGH